MTPERQQEIAAHLERAEQSILAEQAMEAAESFLRAIKSLLEG